MCLPSSFLRDENLQAAAKRVVFAAVKAGGQGSTSDCGVSCCSRLERGWGGTGWEGAPATYPISLSLPRKGHDYESHLKLLL